MQRNARRECSQQRVHHDPDARAEELAVRVVQVDLALVRVVHIGQHVHQAAGGEVGSGMMQRHLYDSGVRTREIKLNFRVADPDARRG